MGMRQSDHNPKFYDAEAGETITNFCRRLVAASIALRQPVYGRHNDTRFRVEPHMTPTEAEREWKRKNGL